MAAVQGAQGPLPPPSVRWIDQPGTPSLAFRIYFLALDAVVRFLIGLVSSPGTAVPLIAVAAPTNANAAAAGVALGQLYRDTADPCKVYIRTV